MSTTTNYGFSKPAGSDSPNGPVQIGALADEVDAELAGGIGFRSRGKSKVTASQTTSSGTFTLLGTPDRVSGLERRAAGFPANASSRAHFAWQRAACCSWWRAARSSSVISSA